MKKTAYINLGSDFNPEEHQAVFEQEGRCFGLYTVRSFEEAEALIKRLADEGYGIIGLCGAFDEERTRGYIKMTGGKVGFSYGVHVPEQNRLFEEFFS